MHAGGGAVRPRRRGLGLAGGDRASHTVPNGANRTGNGYYGAIVTCTGMVEQDAAWFPHEAQRAQGQALHRGQISFAASMKRSKRGSIAIES